MLSSPRRYAYSKHSSSSTARRSPTGILSQQKDDSSSSSRTNKLLNRQQEEERGEVADKLASVGWSFPTSDDNNVLLLTSNDPFVQRIDAEIRRDVGVSLDELLNPAKVVNLERDLYNLRLELEETKVEDDRISISSKIDKKETELSIERRSVFRGWLKNIFLGQAILSFLLSWVMVSDPSLLFGPFDWYQSLQLEMPIKVLGFWWWSLFIVPSLRSRRPGGIEKQALDIAFLATPAISILSPVVTKDPQLIWLANFVVVACSYAYAFGTTTSELQEGEGGNEGDEEENNNIITKQSTPAWLKFVYKSLDFGSGRERGARK